MRACIRACVCVCGSVLLCGGLSQLPGLGDRLLRELGTLLPDTEVALSVPPEGSHLAWIGGSLAASAWENQLRPCVTVSRDDWAECGSAAILRMSPDLN